MQDRCCHDCKTLPNSGELDCFVCRAKDALNKLPADKFKALFGNVEDNEEITKIFDVNGSLTATIHAKLTTQQEVNILGVNQKAGYRDNGMVLAIPDVSTSPRAIISPKRHDPGGMSLGRFIVIATFPFFAGFTLFAILALLLR
jgi:hypothetical protein